MADDLFVFIGFRADGSSVAMEVTPGSLESLAQAMETFRANHTSCVTIEVWQDGVVVKRLGPIDH